MDVVSVGPLRTSSLLWQPRRGAWTLTVVCKATFELVPGEARLAQEQEYPNEEETHWNDDPRRSLHSPSDLAPHKARADVMLVGYAYAPGGEPARSVVARLVVGELDKPIEVFGERAWTPEGQLREGARFMKMPLRYERAAGGSGTPNPVGIGPDARPDVYGNLAVPNLLPPGFVLTSPKDLAPPIGFGPIAATWPERRARLGRHEATWTPRWNLQPLPEDLDPRYFNAAPADQQLVKLGVDERIVLENLHPEHARLTTKLPGVQPRAFVERGPGLPKELPLACDTLWIDTDRAICTLTFRGALPVESPMQAGRVLVGMETPGKRLTASEVLRVAGRATVGTAIVDLSRVDADDPGDAEELTDSHVFPAASAPTPPPPRPRGRPTHETVAAPPELNPLAGIPLDNALPFLPAAEPGPSRGIVNEPTSSGEPPPWIAARFGAQPVAPAARKGTAPPPGLAPGAPPMPPIPPIPPMPSAPIAPPADSVWAAASRTADPAAASPIMPPPIPAVAPSVAGAAGASVVAASNAAAAASAWSLPTPAGPAPVEPTPAPAPRPAARVSRDVVDLIWHDAEAVPRIRAHREWKDVLAELHPPPERKTGFDYDEEPEPEPPKEVEERKDVFAVLTRAYTTDAEGVNEAMAEAVAEDGTFEPPLVLLGGELSFPFDELETLKATVTAVSPFVPGDKKLKETVDMVNELLKTPWLQSSTGVAEGLTQKVREAFAQTSRMLPASHLDAHVDRILLEQRHYQRRTVFGETWIRTLLAMSGPSGSIPTYLPEALVKKLPMFQSLRVRVIAEAHAQQDQYESHPVALRVVALGRLIVPRR